MLYLSTKLGGWYLNKQQVHTAILQVSLFVYDLGKVILEVGHKDDFRISPAVHGDTLLSTVTPLVYLELILFPCVLSL